VATLVKGFDAEPYFRRAETEVWLPHGGRPHWAKLHFLGHVRFNWVVNWGWLT
jgi:hypothetical protein